MASSRKRRITNTTGRSGIRPVATAGQGRGVRRSRGPMALTVWDKVLLAKCPENLDKMPAYASQAPRLYWDQGRQKIPLAQAHCSKSVSGNLKNKPCGCDTHSKEPHTVEKGHSLKCICTHIASQGGTGVTNLSLLFWRQGPPSVIIIIPLSTDICIFRFFLELPQHLPFRHVQIPHNQQARTAPSRLPLSLNSRHRLYSLCAWQGRAVGPAPRLGSLSSRGRDRH